MADKYLTALEEASQAWVNTRHMSQKERVQVAKDLHTYGLFSLNQLAKIARMSAGGVSRHCTKTDLTGGRFQAEALSVLVHIRRVYLEFTRVPPKLVQAAVDSGCSASCIASLTGTPYSTVYKANKQRSA